MKSTAPVPPFLIRIIVLIYALLFLTALFTACYFLRDTVALQPIPMLGLLKYLLLCVLFVMLLINALKALRLQEDDLLRLAESTKNLKWLFIIATIIAIAAKLGCFNQTAHQVIEVSLLQIGVLVSLAVFCLWSDSVWKKLAQVQRYDDDQENTGA